MRQGAPDRSHAPRPTSPAVSLVDIAVGQRAPYWLNLYGPPCDAGLNEVDYTGPGAAGTIVATVVGLSPFAAEPGLPRASAYLGRILVGWELARAKQPRLVLTSLPEASVATSSNVPTIVTVRVLEARGLVDGYMRSARCIVSYGPHRRVTSWRSVSGGGVVFNFRPRRPICAVSLPAYDAAAPEYLRWQASGGAPAIVPATRCITIPFLSCAGVGRDAVHLHILAHRGRAACRLRAHPGWLDHADQRGGGRTGACSGAVV